MIAIFLAPLYILANYYLFRRIMGWVKAWFPGFCQMHHWVLPVLVYIFFALSVLIGFLLPEGTPRRWMKNIGNYWLGVLLYLFLIVALADGLRLLALCVPALRQHLPSALAHRVVGALCLLAIFSVTVGGVLNARNIHVTPYEVTVHKSAGDLSELKVVLTADLHLGYSIGKAQMEQMVEKINAEDPDLVVIAGDIFDNEWEAVQDPDGIAEVLRGIHSRYGVYACYGNHDVEEAILAGFTFRGDGKASSPEMDAFLEKANIRLLRDEAVVLDGEVQLYGRPDASRPGKGIGQRKTAAEITAELDKEKPILVLDHQPKELEELAAAGVDVDLCGHTHDGQLFPGNLVVGMAWENACGYLKKGGMHNIVTSGVGLFGPNMRVGTRAEICPVTIHFDGGKD